MARAKTSRSWMQQHVADPYVRRAQARGYRSRAAFKLLEIDAKDRLFAPGQAVVDLGAAPGSWSQVAAEKATPRGLVVAVDVLAMAPLASVTFVHGDFGEAAVLREVEQALAGRLVDLVLSDMSPNLSGVAAADQARSTHLCELAVDFALTHLAPGGSLLVKAFQGSGFPPLLARIRSGFEHVVSRKPGASRSRSREMYILARGRRIR